MTREEHLDELAILNHKLKMLKDNHYCGYVFIWDNTVATPAFTTTANSEKKAIKKEKVVNNIKKK